MDKTEVAMNIISIDEDCQFLKDLDKHQHSSKDFNGVTLGIYNLITVKAYLKLWIKGLKPYRGFKLKDVKRYFGITGNAEVLLYKLQTIDKVRKGEL